MSKQSNLAEKLTFEAWCRTIIAYPDWMRTRNKDHTPISKPGGLLKDMMEKFTSEEKETLKSLTSKDFDVRLK